MTDAELAELRSFLSIGAPTSLSRAVAEITRLRSRLAAAEADNAAMLKGILDAFVYANDRWSEWGERAETVGDILQAAVQQKTVHGQAILDKLAAITAERDELLKSAEVCPNCGGYGWTQGVGTTDDGQPVQEGCERCNGTGLPMKDNRHE